MPFARLTIPALVVALSHLGTIAPGATDTPVLTQRIQEALAALAENDLARAEGVALAAVQANEAGSWRAWLIVASARQRRGGYRDAQEAYRQFLALCRCPAEHAYASEQIKRCDLAAATSTPPAVSERLDEKRRAALAAVGETRYTESAQHFVVHAYNAELAKLVAAQAEAALTRICEEILYGQAYPHIVNVYVWPDVAEYRKHATSSVEWAGGSFALKHEKDGQVIRRIDLTQLDRDGRFDTTMLDRVLPHEMCHLVLAELFGDAHCPLALNEGLAMMAEATVDNSRVLLAGAAALGNRKISLPQLLRMNRCDFANASIFYAEAFSLTSYLHGRLTQRQFRSMLSEIKAGLPLDEAIQRALYVPPDPDFLKQLARVWESEAIRQAQFLKALDAKLADAS